MSGNPDEIILFGAGDLALEVLEYLKNDDGRVLSGERGAPCRVTDIIDQSGSLSPDLARSLPRTVKVQTDWSKDGDAWYVGLDGREFYVVPDAFVTGG